MMAITVGLSLYAFKGFTLGKLLKRHTDADAEYTEDGWDEQIGATEYAEGDGTRKRGGKAECITQG